MWLGLFITGMAGVAPFALQAQSFFDPCGRCHLPLVQCHCLRTRPVVETQLREEQVTTYRDVLETRYREECVVEHTPVTTYEDRVETVWVPQQVTKKVARTVMVPQARSRTVPYQVMQRIPQTTTRLVPYQTVHHVTEAVPMFATVPAAPVITQSHIAPAPIVTQSPAYVPTIQRSATNAPHKAPPLAPRESKASGEWQVIPPRTSSLDRFGGYEANYENPVPTPIDNEPAVRKASWRGHVPGAASAWNYQDRTAIR
jgi:hypothetical protein